MRGVNDVTVTKCSRWQVNFNVTMTSELWAEPKPEVTGFDEILKNENRKWAESKPEVTGFEEILKIKTGSGRSLNRK